MQPTTSLEQICPYNGADEKTTQIKRLFDTLAEKYDRFNHWLSLGFDRQWRRRAVKTLRRNGPMTILDLACGTGDMVVLLCKRLKPKQVIGVDISEEMMKIGRTKVAKAGFEGVARFEYQDGLSLSYPKDQFDGVTIAFGLRNFANLEQGLAEMYRVLKPGGQLIILELSTPTCFPFKQLYRLYSKAMLSFVGSWFIEKAAAAYLPASIQAMPQGREMMDLLLKQGFVHVQEKALTFGVCTLYSGLK
jgi:demethylmenaquinone methyltransferase/2-methoxy-6-polyprenyl-1,4-benzoquinol methylase